MDRKAYIDKLSEKLKNWDDEILKLESKAREVKDDIQAEYKKQIEDIQLEKKTAMEKLEELKKSSEEAWDALKTGTDKIFGEIDSTFKNVVEKFKKP